MYLLGTTTKAFNEKLCILIGGKVNLTVNVTVRCRANVENQELIRKAFENVECGADKVITVDMMYKTFLQQKVLAIPKQVYEVQTDV